MKQKYYWIIGIITVLGILVISGCAQQQVNTQDQNITPTTPKSEFVIAKLISITNSGFVPSANYYEGQLILSNTITKEEYSIFACSTSWDWVKQDSCYKFNPDEVNKNIDGHKMSAELSGCYVGSLEEVSC